MTRPDLRRRRERGPARALAPTGAAVLVALSLTGATLALWGASAVFRGSDLTAGDLSLELGAPTWEQVTPGVTAPASGAFDGSPPEGFYTMPGDTVVVHQPVVTTLVGKNLAAAFTVRFGDESRLTEDVESGKIRVTFAVLDEEGTVLAPVEGQAVPGESVVVPGLFGSDDGAPEDRVVAISIEVLGPYTWTDGDPLDATGLWDAGALEVVLEQARDGQGFVDGGDL